MYINLRDALPGSPTCEHRQVNWKTFEPDDPALPVRVIVTCVTPGCRVSRTINSDQRR